VTREIAIPFVFEKHLGAAPSPCSLCTTSDGPFHVRVMNEGALIETFCSDCVEDISRALKSKPIADAVPA
jgi:hypothetical protein